MPSRSIAAASPRPAPPPYGGRERILQTLRRGVLAFAAVTSLLGAAADPATARPVQVVALGDSLTAGYQLPAEAAFPVVLEKALRAAGLDVRIANAGVSGDTAAAGLERLDWSVPDGTDAVILELGANDMLRGIDPVATRATLDTIIGRLQARGIKVLLAGMLAMPSLGEDYARRFNPIFPDLAKQHGLPLYAFFLDGVAQDRGLRLPDGMHPTAAGVELMVKSILPTVEPWLRSMPARR